MQPHLVEVLDQACFFRRPGVDVTFRLPLPDWMAHRELTPLGQRRRWNLFGYRGPQLAGVVLAQGDDLDVVREHLHMLTHLDQMHIEPAESERGELASDPPAGPPADQRALTTIAAVQTVGAFQGRLSDRGREEWEGEREPLSPLEREVYDGALRRLSQLFGASQASVSHPSPSA